MRCVNCRTYRGLHIILADAVRCIFNFIHRCKSDSKKDDKQTVNKQGKPNADRTMTKLPVTHIYSTNYQLLRRPTYLSGDLGFTAILSSFFLFYSPPTLELAERNSTRIGHMLRSECDLKTHVRNLGYPLQIEGPKTTFLTTSQLNGTLAA